MTVASEDPGWIEIGTIVAPQGLKGEVRVYPDSDFPERFEKPGQRWLRLPGAPQPQPIQLQKGRSLPQKGLYIIKFADVDTREQAEALRGATLLVPEGDRPTLAPGEYYLPDLIGLRVFNQHTQAELGAVVGLVYAGNNLLEVQMLADPAQKVLIPLVPELVPIVDLEQRRVEVNPLPGLLP